MIPQDIRTVLAQLQLIIIIVEYNYIPVHMYIVSSCMIGTLLHGTAN